MKNHKHGIHFYSHPKEYLKGVLGIQPCNSQNRNNKVHSYAKEKLLELGVTKALGP